MSQSPADGISNHYIESILKPLCADFRGVFSADTIPTQLLQCKTFSIICNLSNVRQLGSHFITIIVQSKRVLYLDSLGLPCVVGEISTFLEKLRKPVFYNSQQIQDYKSKFCGFYCILFVLHFGNPSVPLVFEKEELLVNDLSCIRKIRELLNILY